MAIQKLLLSASLLLLLTFLSTTSAQLSPVSAPVTSPPAPALTQPPAAIPPAAATPPATVTPTAPASAPGMSTVPLVPVTPNAAPSPIVPKGPVIDIVQILRKAKRFSVLIRLLKTTQLINQLNSQLMTSGSGGLTIFAPDDGAFSKLKAGLLNTIDDREKVELLQFHTISSFIAISNFDTLTNPVQTQAGDDPKRLQLNITTYGGNSVSMTTGAVNASVTGTVYMDNKLAIYQVDKVLLPLDIVLPKAKAPAPALAAKGNSPKSDKNKSSPEDQTVADDDKNNDDNSVTADSSAGSVSFKVGLMWVLGVVCGAMI